jgi:hypothetical protein
MPCFSHQILVTGIPELIAPCDGSRHPVARRFHGVLANRFGSERRQLAMPIDNVGVQSFARHVDERGKRSTRPGEAAFWNFSPSSGSSAKNLARTANSFAALKKAEDVEIDSWELEVRKLGV